MEIRAMTDADVDDVLRLNADSVWALSPLDGPGLQDHRAAAAYTLVCVVEDQVAAFAISYLPGSSYPSVNYRWHDERFDDFLYLDRIAVDPAFRRRGIAGAIYDLMELEAKPHGRLVCEVNSDPPNVASLAFHQSRGYREVGWLTQPDGHRVVLLEKPL
jgi:uncharacterized protein